MKKSGFTLIELLAVIVILAIIALIAVPIVISIINDSKNSSEKESIKQYLDTVEKTIAKKQMENPNFKPTECMIKGKKIACDEEEIEIEIKGEIPKSGTIKFGKGMIISGVNIELNNLYYQITNGEVSEGTQNPKHAILLEDNGEQGISRGDKYEYQVNDEDTFIFYVLSIEGNKVNLIMDRNICNDGTVEYTNANLFCRYAWGSNENRNGPIDAIIALGNGTRNWTNVPNMNLEYNDIMDNTSSGYSGSTIYGYTGITITDGVGYITKKDGTTQTPITITDNKPLKARLPKLKEITDEGCHFYSSSVDYGTCSAWLTNGLQQYETYYPENENIIGVLGYWLLSSYSGDSNGARYVSYEGYAGWTATSADIGGVRPVITVLKDNLS